MSRPSKLRIPVWLWGGALVLLLLASYSLRQTRRMKSELSDVSAQIRRAQQQRDILDAERANYQRALEILSDPRARPFPLSPVRPALPVLRAYFSSAHGLLVVGGQVPTPAAGNAYRGWIVTASKSAPAGLTVIPDAQGQVLASCAPGAWQRGQTLEIYEAPPEDIQTRQRSPLWRGTLP